MNKLEKTLDSQFIGHIAKSAMNLLHITCLLWLTFLQGIESRPSLNGFLKSFVENERKPTMVVFNGICWGNSKQVKVMRELLTAGIRSSSLVTSKSSYLDVAVLLLVDLDCPRTQEVFDNATRHNLHKLPFRWLALTSLPLQLASPLWSQFLVNSDLVVAEFDGQKYRMTELHKPSLTGPVIQTPRGEYAGALTDVRPNRELFRRRQDLMGAPLTMVNVIQDTNASKFHILQEDRLELHHDILSKNSWILGKLGFLMLNATPRAVFSYRFGYQRNGKWIGIIKDLIDNKADIGTNIGMTKERLKVVAYIDTMDNTRGAFIFRQPALSYTANIYYLPFSFGVWVAVAVSTAVAALAFIVSMRWNGNHTTLADGFLLSMSAVSQQGCDLEPKNLSARLILFVIFTALMALYAAYGANIVVLLQAPSSSINNLQELSKAKLTLAALDVDYNYFLFKGSKDSVRMGIDRRLDPDKGPKPFYNLTEGVKRLQKGLFAFHALTDSIYRQVEKTFMESEKCDLVEIDYLGYKGLFIPAHKHTPYLELLRVSFRWLRESGIKSAVNFRLEARKPTCKDSVAMFSSVGATELRPVLLFMACGAALSVVVLALEIIVSHFHRNTVSRRLRKSHRRAPTRSQVDN